MAITLDGSSGITTPGLTDSGNLSVTGTSTLTGAVNGAVLSPYTMKNRIINGAMVIDQRNAGASSIATSTGSVYNTVDRWNYYASQASKFTLQQNAGSVTPPSGFTNYLGITSSTAATISSGDIYVIQQFIEGYNVADLDFGKSTAKTITLSFWVRSSLTGTFGLILQNADDTRAYPITYTISSANTWEQKTITIAGDTSGTWATNSGTGFKIRWQLAMGSSYKGTSGAWTSSTVYGVTGATDILATNGATFYLTGVQLEIGSYATPFEWRPYGNELALCQRYYQVYSDYSVVGVGKDTTAAFFGYQLRPTMRVDPTCTFTCTNVDRFGTAYVATSSAAVLDARHNHVTAYANATMSGRGEPCGPAGSLLTVSAEL